MPAPHQGQRWRRLEKLERVLEAPMVALAFVWLILLVLDLVYGLSRIGQIVSDVIWILFVLEFGVKLVLAPSKRRFLLKNWLTLLSLLLPALRILRPLRLLRIVRGTRVLRVVSSLNRGMRALGRAMGRRGFGYVVVLSLLVAFGGAAGMYALERDGGSGGFSSYGDALWWTAMTLTTLGGPYAPTTAEGRILAFLIALYAFSVFGYVAATMASFFVERDAKAPDAETVGRDELARIHDEIRSLREALVLHSEESRASQG